MLPRILVAIIAYNEEASLERTIADLRAHCPHDLVVVDNGSTDGTLDVCRRAHVPYVGHAGNTGSAMGTVATYFAYAYDRGYDVVCQFDGDGQHCAADLSGVLTPVVEGRADYVIGSRFLAKRGFQSTAVRRLGIAFFSMLVSRIVGRRITDVTSGLRAYGRPVIELFARYDHELYDPCQLLLLAHQAGTRIVEVPVEMRPRSAGTSEYASLRALFFPFVTALNVAGCVLRGRTAAHASHP